MTPAQILVVEDESIIAKDIQNSLKNLGYAVPAIASSGEEALTEAAELLPDLALMDIVLKGGMDGIEAAEHMRDRYGIPVVYLTAYGDDQTLARAKLSEPFGYVLKPFDERGLQSTIEMALYKSQREKNLRENEGRLQRGLRDLSALHRIHLAVTSTLDLGALLDLLLEQVHASLPCPAATTVRLFDRKSGALVPKACRNLDEGEWKSEEWRGGRGLIQVVVETKAALQVADVQTDPRAKDCDFFRRHGLVSYLGVPLIAKGELLGALGFYTKAARQFTDEEVDFLKTLGGQAAIAIHNAQLYEEITGQAAALERAGKMQSEFLGVISHELKTPLNVVMGYTGMIKDKILVDQDRALGRIAKSSHDLRTMIDSLLNAARMESGANSVQDETFHLGEFLSELRSFYDFPLDKEVRLIWDYPSTLPMIRTDKGKLRHALENLINNAIKFTDRGYVRISAAVREDPEQTAEGRARVQFQVTDTGAGIPKDALPYIFEKFHQVDSSVKGSHGGVGLGLHIVKTFIRMVGGEIEVESELGKGSTFTVTIPHDTAPLAPREENT